jgi:multidrug efflux pump subunit AcrA (membrane-fusion protein)
VDAQKGLFKAEAQVYVNSAGDLSTGISVSVSLVTSAVNNTIVIPYDAVYYDNNQAYVYCVQGGKAVRMDVTTGLYNEDSIAIVCGLNPGDTVVTSWASGLKNGAEVDAGDDTASPERATEVK